jgi:hypothetical protein
MRRAKRALSELLQRKMESLAIYGQPDNMLPMQLKCHQSQAAEIIVVGSNRCLGGDQEIYDPVLGLFRKVKHIKGPHHVWSRNPDNGELESCEASAPFVKGRGYIYRVTFSSGETLLTTLAHRIVDRSGQWRSVDDAWRHGKGVLCCTAANSLSSERQPPSDDREYTFCSPHKRPRSSLPSVSHTSQPTRFRREDGRESSPPESDSSHHQTISEYFLSESLPDDRRWTRKALSYRDDCLTGHGPCDALPPYALNGVPAESPLPADVLGHTRSYSPLDASDNNAEHIQTCLQSRHPSNKDDVLRLEDRISWTESHVFSCDDELRSANTPVSPQPATMCLAQLHTNHAALPLQDSNSLASHPSRFVGTNSDSIVFITSIELYGCGDIWDISVDPYSNYLCAGVINANSGKSQVSAASVVWAATGTHPWYDYPNENVKIYCVGWDQEHIQKVMWPKIGRAGSIRIIRDEHTRKWRPVVPDAPYDSAYLEKQRDAPPFLPPRLIADISWYSKKDSCPSKVILRNGSEISFYSSKGTPQQGASIHYWWADEELEHQYWISELERGCVSYNGRGIYSATAQASSEQLYTMHQRATAIEKTHDVEEFFLLMYDNIYVAKSAKDTFRSQLTSDEEIQVRIYGKFAITSLAVYPEYDKKDHIVEDFTIPDDWCRYLVVDPGAAVCAVLFAALPPPMDDKNPLKEYQDRLVIYDELYIKRCSHEIFAERVAQKMGHLKRGGFQGFLIDGRMAKNTEMTGKTVEALYSEALIDQKIYSQDTGSDFIHGSPDGRAREESLKMYLRKQFHDSTPRLAIHKKCRNLDWEFGQQFYVKRDGQPSDKRRDKHNHAVTCAEYLAAFDPCWIPPNGPDKTDTPILRAIKQIRMRNRKSDHTQPISIGPLKIGKLS